MQGEVDQSRFPEQFRIEAPVYDPVLLSAAEQLAAAVAALPVPSPAAVSPSRPLDAPEAGLSFVADLGTALFRLRRLLWPPGARAPSEDSRRAFRHLDSAWSVLERAGVQILDHHDEPVPEGDWAVRILAFEPTMGVTRARVKDTVKPTIYFHDRQVQVAEVIVAIPQEENGL